MSGDTTFHRLLWDDAELLKNEPIKLVKDNKIRRVVMCSGKVYFDLYEEREKRGINDIYLLRLEQLYPFPAKALINELSRFKQRRDGLVPGRAQEHGCLVVHRSLSGMGAGAYRCQVPAGPLHRPPGFGLDGDRPDVAAPCTT
jgi:2-oxoglutarate dehydrogenase complex dehydrogenase (E1) component-like enzyme